MHRINQLKGRIDTFEHVVVLMLENRSFDSLLGFLYSDDVPLGQSFEGLYSGRYNCPVPEFAAKGQQGLSVAPSRACDFHQPFPDPGEEYEHVNTQLFNQLDSHNRCLDAFQMQPPYNLPASLPVIAPMNGFVSDYINVLQSTYHKAPDSSHYSKIMQCFQPDQVNVLVTLAKEFAVFDHWFSSVPSQTWCNRAFWHAGTSGGKVINPLEEHGNGIEGTVHDVFDMASWGKAMWSEPTLLDRMSENGISWGIYAPKNYQSLTNLIHGVFKHSPDALHHFDHFYQQLEQKELPQYCFLEPEFLHQHNDQHPSYAKHPNRYGAVFLGELLILDVYNAIKSSRHYRDRTLLIITHDEHGGCFDHVSPPAATPPKAGAVGQRGFKFDRLGVRVPMVMASSYIQPGTVINSVFDHTALIKTLCKKWGDGWAD